VTPKVQRGRGNKLGVWKRGKGKENRRHPRELTMTKGKNHTRIRGGLVGAPTRNSPQNQMAREGNEF